MSVKPNSRVLLGLSVAGLIFGAFVFMPAPRSRAQAQDPQVGSRQIVDKVFTGTRPAGNAPPNPGTPAAKSYRRVRRTRISVRGPATVTPPIKPPTTTRPPASPTPNVAAEKWDDIPETADKLGVTIWRVRPPQAGEQGARLLVQQVSLVPERVASDTILNVGDQVFLSVESPRSGYLYIIDREIYADGKLSDPYLIFPTRTTRGGDNRVTAGKLIDIPDRNDPGNTFVLKPQPPNNNQVGELLSIIVTTEPLDNSNPERDILRVTPAESMQQLSAAKIAYWENRWGGRNEQFELAGGAGQVMSVTEQDAGRTGVNARLLLQTAPPPQTFYLVDSGNRDGLLVNVELRYRR